MEFDADDWKIFSKNNLDENISETSIDLRLALKNNTRGFSLRKEDLQQLKKDLQDLGKWRRFKELKKDLGE